MGRYRELPRLPTGVRHSWGLFGTSDDIGTLNFICRGCRRRAAAAVVSGEVVALSLPLDEPTPALVPGRDLYMHQIEKWRSGRDDRLDGLYPQYSSQWDSLAHIRYREFGYYGGLQEDDLDAGRLGIDRPTQHGVVTRGVLADVVGYLKSTGVTIDQTSRFAISAELIERTLARQRTSVEAGDVLLIRTGWLAWYQGLPREVRNELGGRLLGPDRISAPGLDPCSTPEWLWDHGIAAVAADNASVEVLPVRREEGYLHRSLIALLGMMLGELWPLDDLAARCASAGRWTFLLAAPPLMLPLGVGSPCNAYAVL